MSGFNGRFLEEVKIYFEFNKKLVVKDFSTDLIFLLESGNILENIENSLCTNLNFNAVDEAGIVKSNVLRRVDVMKITVNHTSSFPELMKFINENREKDLAISQYIKEGKFLSWYRYNMITLDKNYNAYLVKLIYSSEIGPDNSLFKELDKNYTISDQVIYNNSDNSYGMNFTFYPVGRFKKTMPTGYCMYFIIPKEFYESNLLFSEDSEGEPILTYIKDNSCEHVKII
jgi:hypothetical protein